MKKFPTILLFLLIALWGVAADSPVTDDQKNIQGTWIVESMSEDGEVIKEGPDQMVFAGDQLTMSDKSGKEKKGAFKLEPTQTPKVLLFPLPHAANVIPAHFAYELDGDRLKIVNSAPNRKPTAINDQRQLLYILKRQKP